MKKIDFSPALDSGFMKEIWRSHLKEFFPDISDRKITRFNIKRISPPWATDTVVAKYEIEFGGEKKILWGTGSNLSSKREVWKIMRSLFLGGAPISRPVDFIATLNILISEGVPGTSFTYRLTDGSYITKDAGTVGRTLAGFHCVSIESRLREMRSFDLKDYRRATRQIRAHMSEISLGDDVSQMFETVLSRAVSRFAGICHGDFYPGNIMIDGDKASIIDLDCAGRGNQLLDVAMMWAFFDFPEEMSPLRLSAPSRASLCEEFVASYCKARGVSRESIQKILKWHIAKVLLDQVSYHTFFEVKGWNEKKANERQYAIQKIGKLIRAAEKYYVEATEEDGKNSQSLL